MDLESNKMLVPWNEEIGLLGFQEQFCGSVGTLPIGVNTAEIFRVCDKSPHVLPVTDFWNLKV